MLQRTELRMGMIVERERIMKGQARACWSGRKRLGPRQEAG